jgi:hypothetical protein
MRTALLILTVGFLIVTMPLHAQFRLPKVSYNKVDVIRNEKEVIQKRFFTKGELVLEVNYPDHEKGHEQELCYKSNIVNDSTYIFYGNQRRTISFRRDVIYATSWVEGTLVTQHETYYPTGELWYKYTQVAVLDPVHPQAPCSFDHFFIGEYLEYDKDGKIVSSKNYNTGKQAPQTTPPTAELAKLYSLKKVADGVVSKSFGKDFFNKNITVNFDKSGYHGMRERYDGNVPSHGGGTDWFFYPDKEIQYVDFVYSIKPSEYDYYSTIIVRLDRAGNLVKDVIKQYRDPINSTLGLVAKPMSNILSKDAAIKLAMSEGLKEAPVVDLIWEADQPGSSYGSYYYSLLFDKVSRNGPGYGDVYFRQWLVNIETKQIIKDREYITGESTVEEPGIDKTQKDGKYGFENKFLDKILIPFEYDELPDDYDAFMIARKDGKIGAINFENETRIPFIFDKVYYISVSKLERYKNQYLIVEKGNRMGLYNADGKELFPTTFTRIEKGENEQVIGYKDAKVAAILDLRTNKVTEK